jgi:hypothetical protein
MTAITPQWEAFANWLAMDEQTRTRLNLPQNQTQYAFANKISDRQLRRWKTDPLFQALLEKKGARSKPSPVVSSPASSAVAESGSALVDVVEPEQSEAAPEDEYIAIKSALVKGAMTGDPKYLDLYFKTYGKEFVAEEAAARTSDLAGLDLGDLILEAASSLDVARVADYLRSQGYDVREPKGVAGE